MSRAAIAILARLLLIALLWSPALPSFAQANQQADAAPLHFNTLAEEARFHDLTLQLRCVMCQNQSLADSNAQIAHDLRREVFELMRAGRTDAEIKAFLVERYGEFVLYKPPVRGHTWLLWFGPALLLIAGAFVVARIVRARSRGTVAEDDGQEW